MLSIDGSALSMATNFGAIGFGTLSPGNGTLEEQICFTGLVNNANGTTTLTGVSSVLFVYPYTKTSGLLKTHAGSTPFVISNTAGYYDELTSKDNNETINQVWTFATGATPLITDQATTNTMAANKLYVDTAVATRQAGIQFEDEGVNLGTSGTATELDFVGSGVVATRVGNKVTATITGASASGSKLATSTTQVTVGASTTTTAYTVAIPGGTLGTNNAIKYTIMMSNFNNQSQTFQINIKYGGTTISQLARGTMPAVNDGSGLIMGIIMANAATNAQKGQATLSVGNFNGNSGGPTDHNVTSGYATAAIDSTASQNLTVQVITGASDQIVFEGILVENIF